MALLLIVLNLACSYEGIGEVFPLIPDVWLSQDDSFGQMYLLAKALEGFIGKSAVLIMFLSFSCDFLVILVINCLRGPEILNV